MSDIPPEFYIASVFLIIGYSLLIFHYHAAKNKLAPRILINIVTHPSYTKGPSTQVGSFFIMIMSLAFILLVNYAIYPKMNMTLLFLVNLFLLISSLVIMPRIYTNWKLNIQRKYGKKLNNAE